MPDAFRSEFTGERVIPGRVEDNLFNEHFARYRFAVHLANSLGIGGEFLDAGCGAGYGAAELAKSGARVLGIDVSEDAVAHARAHYANVRFEQASCTAIPAGDRAFRLVTAFEVIEHLADWRDFLREAWRVLDPAGIFLVSTPNQLYYAESRQKAGPNPFHVHEFTAAEFQSELELVFPHVKVLLQNHVAGIAFVGDDTEGVALEIGEPAPDPAAAHFFLAVCGKQPLPPIARFVYIPESGNVLQTRERHIALLDGEIQQKNQWIQREQSERNRMLEKVRAMEIELEEHNRWAQKANEEADRRARLVAELQEELRRSNEWAKARDRDAEERGQRIVELQAEMERATQWAKSRDAEAEARGVRIVQLQDELQREQENMAESTAVYEAAIEQWRVEKEASDRWALETESRLSEERDAARAAFAAKAVDLENSLQRVASLEAELEDERKRLNAELADSRQQLIDARRQLEMIAQSRWVRLGRVVRVGPEIAQSQS